MVDDTQLAESKSIHRATGKTFYYATKLLPERVRHATYVLYAFFRVADEVVDNPDGMSPDEQRRRLDSIREAALGRDPTDDPVLSAFSELRESYDIPDEEIEVFIDAMCADIETSRYDTYEELETYMRGSAAAVGVMMTLIMECDDPDTAIPHARTLGEAFQLTNFIRDVGEDIVDRDRIYLPRETLEGHGADPADIEARQFTDEIGAAIEHELRRAEGLYREGVAGIQYLPRDCQLPVLTAAVLYADHHRLVRQRGYDTVTETPSLSTWRKLSLVARTRWHWFWSKDPETVFAKVSVVPSAADHRTERRPNEPSPTR
ncbi:phytoene/squalene synthase family protein [Natronomonas gomsonensis]|uniref:phytoene/squalene synthase family protein n=1 Tax=Natronomonas gomsonensis TaxID=1046043 RepID=UPI0020CA8DC8|nr:phytoene/squalene synthase family protein [Natronomonas gomsonensis]MCY4731872.1 phytoene/squalene synthase family protein [Natronomonas gomsonensis]